MKYVLIFPLQKTILIKNCLCGGLSTQVAKTRCGRVFVLLGSSAHMDYYILNVLYLLRGLQW